MVIKKTEIGKDMINNLMINKEYSFAISKIFVPIALFIPIIFLFVDISKIIKVEIVNKLIKIVRIDIINIFEILSFLI